MSKQVALATLFYRELEKILDQVDLHPKDQAEAVYQLLQLVFQEATRREKLPFATHFARTAYAAHKYGLHKSLQYYLHLFRRRVRQPGKGEEQSLALGVKVVSGSDHGHLADSAAE
jgi:DNA replication ATP-dependent helicase Dna2